jgi:hypothetical protein
VNKVAAGHASQFGTTIQRKDEWAIPYSLTRLTYQIRRGRPESGPA